MISVTVMGTPRPQGSMRAFVPKNGTKPIVTSDNPRLKPWREQIAWEVLRQRPILISGPVAITMAFYFRRPKSDPHRIAHTVKPDIDKLCRSCLDALKGVVLSDDAQVVKISAQKEYTYGHERVTICLEEVRP